MSSPPRPLPSWALRRDLPSRALLVGSPLTKAHCRVGSAPREPPAAPERSRHVESASAPLQFRYDLP